MMLIEWFLIMAILTGSFIVILKHFGLLLLQIICAAVVTNFLPESWFLAALLIQAIFGLWILRKVFQAVHYHYQLEMEQTQRISQQYTEGGKFGRKKNFLL